FERCVKLGEPYDEELQIITGTGRRVWVRTMGVPERDASGKIVRILGGFQDISELKKAQEDLAQSREMLDLFLDSTTDMAFLKDSSLKHLITNQAYLDFMGMKAEEVLGRTDQDLLPPFLAEQCLKGDLDALRSDEQVLSREFSDGRVFEARKFPVPFSDGSKGVGGPVRDITDRWRAEEDLRESEERFRGVFENATLGLYRTSPEGKILMANPSLVKMLGYSSFDELASRDLSKDGFEPDYPREFFQQKVESEGEIRGLESAWTRRDGTVLFVRESARAVYDPDGKVLYYEGTVEDITERKQAEETLKRQSLRLENVINGASVATWEWNVQTGETVINDIWANIIGYRLEELSPVSRSTWEAIIHPEDLKRVYERIALHVEGKLPYYDCEIRKKHKDGHWVWVYDRGTIMTRSADGRPLVMFGIYTDITKMKEAEEKLRRSFGATIEVLTQVVERRDPYTAGHQRRVAALAAEIALAMGMGAEAADEIRMTGYVHDIGKISVPAEILSKPGKLSAIEMNIIKEHPQNGREILQDVEASIPLAEIVHQHHERLDGSGYPRGLRGGDILIEARILAVADVVEAMASYRPYRPALGIEDALEEIEKNRGILYDPDVVDVCLRLFREKGYVLAE
ncbi:MAG TPA: PAS domain S-box protein, partial [Synergistetes bacterium]|nr:PAS domain S-box protein [Synergistota bacterium]